MHHLGMSTIDAPPAPQPEPSFVTMWVPAAPVDGLWYPAKDLSDPVEAGEMLGRDPRRVRSGAGERAIGKGRVHPVPADEPVGEQGEALLGVGTALAST